jgi:three-Cys-motif partner protein
MSEPGFRLDEVGDWSLLKLDIIEKYGAAYTKAFLNRGRFLKKFYIDGYSGAGVHLVKRTREQIEGSPSRALRTTPPFDGFHFIDLNADKTAHLRQLCARAGHADADIQTGDANQHLRELLPTIRYKDHKRALCLLDPYGLQLDWEVMEIAGRLGTIDMFLNFPIMDMNRNALLWRPERASPEDIKRMTRFWGDQSWQQAVYRETGQPDLFGAAPEKRKQPNAAIIAAFRERLQKVAGFQFVPDPLPMTNRNNAVVYYLFFACKKPVAANIINDIFRKARLKG